MVTREQALTAQEFHAGECSMEIGVRGGIKRHIEVWRRNGKTQTWKTRPDEFRVPIKWGLRNTSQLWHWKADRFHALEDCPLLEQDRMFSDERHQVVVETV